MNLFLYKYQMEMILVCGSLCCEPLTNLFFCTFSGGGHTYQLIQGQQDGFQDICCKYMNSKGEISSNTTENLPCGQLTPPLSTPDVKAKNMRYTPMQVIFSHYMLLGMYVGVKEPL